MVAGALHVGHLASHFRLRVPSAASYLQRCGRSLSVALPRRADYDDVNKILYGEAHEPYPAERPSSVFEDATDEYTAFAPTRPPVHITADTVDNDMLLALVRRRQLDGALALMDELEAAGVPIREHAEYGVVEQETFRPTDARAFLRLWAKVPDYEPESGMDQSQAGRFTGLLRPFFDRGRDLLPLANFAILAASKGYGELVGERVITHVVRFAPPAFSTAFVDQFVHEVAQHAGAGSKVRHLRFLWHNLVVRGHAMTLRLDVAARHLLKARNVHGVLIQEMTYKILVQELTKSSRDDLLAVVKPLAADDHPLLDLEFVNDGPTEPDGERLADTILAKDSDEEAARALRDVMDVPPHVELRKLADLMEDCMTTGRTGVVDTIDVWANTAHIGQSSGRPPFWTARWTAGVMLYFKRRQQWDIVLQNFFHRFQTYGLPIEPLFANRAQVAADAPLKLWPNRYAQSMALQALIALTNDSASLEQLYNAFCDMYFSDLVGGSTPPPAMSSGQGQHDADEGVVDPVDLTDAAFGQPQSVLPTYRVWGSFLKQAFVLDRAHGRQMLFRLLGDMHRFGMPPNTLVWTRVLLNLTIDGQYKLVLYLLDRMAGTDAYISEFEWPAAYRMPAEWERELPRPDIICYGALIHQCAKNARSGKGGEGRVRTSAVRVGHQIRQRMIRAGFDPEAMGGERVKAQLAELDALTERLGPRTRVLQLPVGHTEAEGTDTNTDDAAAAGAPDSLGLKPPPRLQDNHGCALGQSMAPRSGTFAKPDDHFLHPGARAGRPKPPKPGVFSIPADHRPAWHSGGT